MILVKLLKKRNLISKSRPSKHTDDDCEYYKKLCKHYEDVIEVLWNYLQNHIKKGNQKCVWKSYQDINNNSSTFGFYVECKGEYITFDKQRHFNYCPYCGKRISVETK